MAPPKVLAIGLTVSMVLAVSPAFADGGDEHRELAAAAQGLEPGPPADPPPAAPVEGTPTPGAPAPEETAAAVAAVGNEELEPADSPTVELTEEEAPLAKKGFSEKWRTFTQATQGLLVWDFFDGRLTIRSHARVKVDGTFGWADDTYESFYGEVEQGIRVRELSLWAQGTVDHHLRYSFSFDFGADAGVGDAFVEGRDRGLDVFGYRVGQFRVGIFQEPFSFERTMSSHYTGLLERALPVWTFSPGYNLGYMLHDTAFNRRMQWAVGFFSFGQTTEANSSNSVLSLTTRVTGLPIVNEDESRLLHFGASFSTRDPKNGTVQYRSRPEARFVDFLIDTGEIEAGRIHLLGAEAVAVAGPIHVQSEVIVSQLEQTDYGDLDLWGAYVQAGWFITGEHHSYDRELGVFSRIAPKTDAARGVTGLFSKRPGGAVELVGRLSKVDLNDGGLEGGEMTNLSVGLNWYLSSTSIVKLNYIRSSVEDRGRTNIVLLRYQFRPLPVPGWR
jgi:phosphate-selective porin OprO/OprP